MGSFWIGLGKENLWVYGVPKTYGGCELFLAYDFIKAEGIG